MWCKVGSHWFHLDVFMRDISVGNKEKTSPVQLSHVQVECPSLGGKSVGCYRLSKKMEARRPRTESYLQRGEKLP